MPYYRTRGLGADPSNPCYDPNRPSWMPYWLNDGNETACLNAAGNPVSMWAQIQQAGVNPSFEPNPVIAQQTPGLPSGYNPQTGTVASSNTTGQTPEPPTAFASVTIPSNPGGSDNSGPSDTSWLCTTFGLNCASPVSGIPNWVWWAGGVLLLGVWFGGRR